MKSCIFVSTTILFLILTSCADSRGGNSNNPAPSNRTKYFKAVSGPGNEYFPAIGFRSYDNQTTVYNFWKPCQGEHDESVRLHTGINNEPIDWSQLYGPGYTSASCKIDANLDYSNGSLVVGGTFNGNTLNVKMQEISKDEFINLLESDKVGLASKYNALSSFDQDKYDDACETLFGTTCAVAFQ